MRPRIRKRYYTNQPKLKNTYEETHRAFCFGKAWWFLLYCCYNRQEEGEWRKWGKRKELCKAFIFCYTLLLLDLDIRMGHYIGIKSEARLRSCLSVYRYGLMLCQDIEVDTELPKLENWIEYNNCFNYVIC